VRKLQGVVVGEIPRAGKLQGVVVGGIPRVGKFQGVVVGVFPHVGNALPTKEASHRIMLCP
jgi:hypothetical protein